MIEVTKANSDAFKEGAAFIMKAKGNTYLLKCNDLLGVSCFQWMQLSTYCVWDNPNSKGNALSQVLEDSRCSVYAIKYEDLSTRIERTFKVSQE